MAELERTGVSLVVENANKAISDLTSFNKALGQTEKAATQVGKGGFKGLDISGVLNKNVPSLNKLNSAFGQFIPQLGQASSAASGLQGALAAGLTPAVLGTAAAFAAAAVAVVGFVKLGLRGAQLQPTINAFGNLAAQLGDTTVVLNQLREDTRGLVPDLELMRLATFTLSGASQELIDIFSQQDTSIGKLIDKTGQLAQALGKDPVEAQNRFIDAIKKGERELLDELGIIVGAEEAYAKYAESIGVSASALTEQQKKAAFAQEAILQLDAAVTKAGANVTTVSDLLRVPATAITNILDKLALAIQPAFAPIAKIVADIFNGIQQAFTYVYPIINSLASLFGQLITTFRQVGDSIFSFLFAPFLRLAGDIIPYVIAAFKLMVNAITSAVKMVGNIVSSVFNTFASVRDKIFGDTSASIEQLAFTLARGGGFIIGSFAAGLLNGGKYVVIAVTKIAQIVADFLQGFSPPKEGPLSQIDKGGENVAKAWVDGFKDQFLKPAAQVAEEVNKALGVIGTFTKDQVEGRLAALDLAIRPFVEQAKIAAAQFEAIAGFIDPALEALDRQRKIALEQFAQGKISAEQLRALDAQFAKLSEFKAEQQAVADAAAIQLALAQAQQAEERALLEIQLARLDAVEETATATEEALDKAGGGNNGEKPPKETTPKEEKPKTGSGGELPQEGAAAAPFTGGAAPDLLSNAAIDKATQVLTSGFNKGLEDAGFGEALAGFTSATGELGTQLERVATSDPVQGIVDKFAGLEDGVGTIVETFKNTIRGIETAIAGVATTVTTFLDVIKRAFDNVLGSAGVQRIIQDTNMIIDSISERVGLVALVVPTMLDSVKNAFTEKIENGVLPIIEKLAGEEGLAKISTILTTLGETLPTLLEPIKTAFMGVFGSSDDPTAGIAGSLNSLVAPDGLLGENGLFVNAINAAFMRGGLLDQAIAEVPVFFEAMQSGVETAVLATTSFLDANFVQPFMLGKDLILGAITSILDAFGSFSTELEGKMSGFSQALIRSFGMPVQNIFNQILSAAESAINSLIEVANKIPGVNIGLASFGRINVFEAARGGTNLKGLGIVGERGAELVNFGGGGADVIPANMTQRLIAAANAMGRSPSQSRLDKIMAKYGSGGLMGMMGSSQPIAMRPQANTASQTSIDRSRNIQATFNNTSQNDSILIMRQLEALG